MANRNQISNPVTDFWPQFFEPFRHMGSRLAEWFAPASEASSDSDAYRITIELPGVSEEDIELNVEGGVMTVKGEKKTEREDSGDTWFFSERRYGAFSRSFRLPEDADADTVKAEMKDGVLTVTLPRTAPARNETKRIPIARS
ncbi:MAG: Hsp20/alpha crystallin family protein [Oceanicaulis sp.]|nr:Hsp20/alpha crystallin family protein [Oceanicaulis sp.]